MNTATTYTVLRATHPVVRRWKEYPLIDAALKGMTHAQKLDALDHMEAEAGRNLLLNRPVDYAAIEYVKSRIVL
jgi:hypothetical protein